MVYFLKSRRGIFLLMSTIQADKFKDEGNNEFKLGNYAKAIGLYGKAIDLAAPCVDEDELDTTIESPTAAAQALTNKELLQDFPNLHIYYSNRSLAQNKLENYGSAVADASKAIALVPNFSKAYYRRGCSKVALAKYKEALKDFERCCQLVPTDMDAQSRFKECKREVQAQAFARAIATDVTAKPSETVKLDSFTIPSDYDGPRFDGDVPSEEFLSGMLDWFKDQKKLPAKYAYKIALQANKLFHDQCTLTSVSVAPNDRITICGDVHGQFYDLLHIFDLNGRPSESNAYLFNGDFVDRGSFSVEVILTLMAYKVAYPDHMHLTRGNHEARSMNKLYGFEGEITAKYEVRLYSLFCELFCQLPLAHLINEKIFVVHGGLFTQDNVTLADIAKIDRFNEPPDSGLMSDMMWADPCAVRGRHPSKRGVGLAFGPDITESFCQLNGVQLVVRSHEVKDEGYEFEHGGKLVTVFSAPNYCDQMNNKGAFLLVSFPTVGGDAKVEPVTFSAVPHPPVRAMQYANRAIFGQ